ncbi:MAG: transposase [Myxococcota bacterium]
MDALEELGQEIGQLTPGRGRRYSDELKRRVVAAVQREHAGGRSWSSCARALGIPVQTLSRWLEEVPLGLALRPVTIVAEPVREEGEPILVAPGGYVVEGLDVYGIAELLRTLACSG